MTLGGKKKNDMKDIGIKGFYIQVTTSADGSASVYIHTVLLPR